MGRRRLRNVVLSTALIAPAVIALTPTASYAVDPSGTCSVTSGVATVTFDANAANGDTAGFGYDIDDVTGTHLALYLAHDTTQLPAVSCGATTIDNITSINITGTADGNSLGIDGIQRTDSSFVPMSIDLGGGLDFVLVDPTSQPKTTLGTNGLDFDADGQVDLTLAGVEQTQMYGTNGNDTMSCGGGHGTGGPSNISCILVGGAGNDTLIGGNGNDVFSDGDGDDTVFGGAGNDQLGDATKDLRTSGNSTFYADGGYNTYYGGPGKDTFVHGIGHDTISYADSKVKVKVSIDGKANDGAKGEHDNVGLGFAKIIGGKGNDVIDASNPPDGAPHTKYKFIGGAGNDKLTGFSSADVLIGGTGNDTLTGLGGTDDLVGGAGKDKLYGGAGADGLDGGSGKDYCNGGPSADNYQHCEVKK